MDAARDYLTNGWQVVAIPPREKGPHGKDWNTHPPTFDELPRLFARAGKAQAQPNIGLLTGAISGGLVDVDCDTPEAARAAAVLLPATGRVSGRAGHPASHYWYICAVATSEGASGGEAGEQPLATVKYGLSASPPPLPLARGRGASDATFGPGSPSPRRERGSGGEDTLRPRDEATHAAMLVELRGDGCQTVAPPSIHPSGEWVRWERDGEPAVVAYDALRVAVGQVAACALLARSWPAVGLRDEAAMALSGMLARAGWSAKATGQFVTLVARIAGDEEWSQRAKGDAAARRLAAGEEVTGATRLAERLAGDGPAIVAKAWKWLGFDTHAGHAAAHGLGSATARPDEAAPAFVMRLVRSRADALPDKELTWLWPGRIPFGALTLLDGDPGLGKSLITLDLAARLTRGLPMPEEVERRTGGALLLSAEDDPSATVRPRLLAAGANLDRVTVIHAVEGWDAERGVATERGFQLPGDIPLLEEAVREIDAKLLVIDPLMAYLDGRLNSWRDQDVRGALAPLTRLAEQLDIAVLILRHLTKGGGTNALYRGGGSIGVIGAARSGLLVAKDRDDPEHARVLAATKSNLGPPVSALRYRMTVSGSSHPRVEWLGPVATTANELLAENEHPTKARTAELDDWLRAQLAEGPLPGREIERRARQEGWTPKQLRDARERVGALVKREGSGTAAMSRWSLRAEGAAGSLLPSHGTPAHIQMRAQVTSEGTSDRTSSVRGSLLPSLSTPALKVKRAQVTSEGTSTSDYPPMLSVQTPNATPRVTLVPHTACPEPASGGAHEYALPRHRGNGGGAADLTPALTRHPSPTGEGTMTGTPSPSGRGRARPERHAPNSPSPRGRGG